MPRVKKTIGERSAMTSPRHFLAVARTTLSLFGFAAIAFGVAAPAAAAQTRKPNIIVIVADDLGYNDVSLNGNPLVRTPQYRFHRERRRPLHRSLYGRCGVRALARGASDRPLSTALWL